MSQDIPLNMDQNPSLLKDTTNTRPVQSNQSTDRNQGAHSSEEDDEDYPTSPDSSLNGFRGFTTPSIPLSDILNTVATFPSDDSRDEDTSADEEQAPPAENGISPAASPKVERPPDLEMVAVANNAPDAIGRRRRSRRFSLGSRRSNSTHTPPSAARVADAVALRQRRKSFYLEMPSVPSQVHQFLMLEAISERRRSTSSTLEILSNLQRLTPALSRLVAEAVATTAEGAAIANLVSYTTAATIEGTATITTAATIATAAIVYAAPTFVTASTIATTSAISNLSTIDTASTIVVASQLATTSALAVASTSALTVASTSALTVASTSALTVASTSALTVASTSAITVASTSALSIASTSALTVASTIANISSIASTIAAGSTISHATTITTATTVIIASTITTASIITTASGSSPNNNETKSTNVMLTNDTITSDSPRINETITTCAIQENSSSAFSNHHPTVNNDNWLLSENLADIEMIEGKPNQNGHEKLSNGNEESVPMIQDIENIAENPIDIESIFHPPNLNNEEEHNDNSSNKIANNSAEEPAAQHNDKPEKNQIIEGINGKDSSSSKSSSIHYTSSDDEPLCSTIKRKTLISSKDSKGLSKLFSPDSTTNASQPVPKKKKKYSVLFSSDESELLTSSSSKKWELNDEEKSLFRYYSEHFNGHDAGVDISNVNRSEQINGVGINLEVDPFMDLQANNLHLSNNHNDDSSIMKNTSDVDLLDSAFVNDKNKNLTNSFNSDDINDISTDENIDECPPTPNRTVDSPTSSVSGKIHKKQEFYSYLGLTGMSTAALMAAEKEKIALQRRSLRVRIQQKQKELQEKEKEKKQKDLLVSKHKSLDAATFPTSENKAAESDQATTRESRRSYIRQNRRSLDYSSCVTFAATVTDYNDNVKDKKDKPVSSRLAKRAYSLYSEPPKLVNIDFTRELKIPKLTYTPNKEPAVKILCHISSEGNNSTDLNPTKDKNDCEQNTTNELAANTSKASNQTKASDDNSKDKDMVENTENREITRSTTPTNDIKEYVHKKFQKYLVESRKNKPAICIIKSIGIETQSENEDLGANRNVANNEITPKSIISLQEDVEMLVPNKDQFNNSTPNETSKAETVKENIKPDELAAEKTSKAGKKKNIKPKKNKCLVGISLITRSSQRILRKRVPKKPTAPAKKPKRRRAKRRESTTKPPHMQTKDDSSAMDDSINESIANGDLSAAESLDALAIPQEVEPTVISSMEPTLASTIIRSPSPVPPSKVSLPTEETPIIPVVHSEPTNAAKRTDSASTSATNKTKASSAKTTVSVGTSTSSPKRIKAPKAPFAHITSDSDEVPPYDDYSDDPSEAAYNAYIAEMNDPNSPLSKKVQVGIMDFETFFQAVNPFPVLRRSLSQDSDLSNLDDLDVYGRRSFFGNDPAEEVHTIPLNISDDQPSTSKGIIDSNAADSKAREGMVSVDVQTNRVEMVDKTAQCEERTGARLLSIPNNLAENPLLPRFGPALYMFYEAEILIVVQERLITFWKYSQLPGIIAPHANKCRAANSNHRRLPRRKNLWFLLGRVRRRQYDVEITNGCLDRISMNNSSPVYAELRSSEYPKGYRECNLSALYVNVYSFNETTSECEVHSVDFDAVQSLPERVLYTGLKDSNAVLVCWSDRDSHGRPKSGIVKYLISSQCDALTNILRYKYINHEIRHIELLFDDKLLGYGHTRLSIWASRTGDLLVNYDLHMPLGNTLGVTTFPDHLMHNVILLHQYDPIPDENGFCDLVVIAADITQSGPDYRLLCRNKIPKEFFLNVKKKVHTGDHIVLTTENNEDIWISCSDASNVVYLFPKQSSRFYFRHKNRMAELTESNLTVMSMTDYLVNVATAGRLYKTEPSPE